jgi:signal transduction histidine kinase
MRTPMVALKAASELPSDKAGLPGSNIAHHTSNVRNAGAPLTKSADDFAELLEPSGPRSLDFRITAPDLILRGVHAAMNATADAAGHRILNKDTAGGHVETDVPVLVKLLGRLVGNAISSSADKAEVMVTAYAENDHEVTFEVTNHGPGISPTQIDKASKPFGNFDMSPGGRSGGPSEELTFAEQTACMLGGHVRLLSEAGQGTRAAVILPRNACLLPKT